MNVDIDRQIKRPAEFRLFYWLGLWFLLFQFLIYLALVISINFIFDATADNENNFIRLFV